MHDVVVVGGGVIGLAIAREVAGHGKSVLVLDHGAQSEAASWAAAGMLAPQSEADQPDPFFHLSMASLRMHRAWTDHLREQTGVDSEYVRAGLLYAAATDEELLVLRRRVEWQRACELAAEFLTPEEAKNAEPLLTLPLAGAVLMPHEDHVTPRRLLKVLKAACSAKGVDIRNGQHVAEIVKASNRVTGIRTA